VSFTLLVGAKQKKLDMALVEKLMAHAASVQLIRLTSSGKNALDFALAYYLGRTVLADSTGYFHVVTKDAGFDPLIEHLRSRGFRARRHESFATLTFSGPPKAAAPVAPALTIAAPKVKAKSIAKPKTPAVTLEDQMAQVLAHFRSPKTTRPRNREKLVAYLIGHLGHKLTEAEAQSLVERLVVGGHLVIGDKGVVKYQLEAGERA
jgi:PIN domain